MYTDSGFESLDQDIGIVQLEVYMNACYDEEEINDQVLDRIQQEAQLEMPPLEYYYKSELLEVMRDLTEEEALAEEKEYNESLNRQEEQYREELRKYNDSYEKQKKARKIITLDIPLTKQEIIDEYFEMIDIYKMIYDLPPIEISETNWQLFLNVIYDALGKRKELNYFKEIITSITKRVFAEALVKELNSIVLDYFIYYINFLDEYGLDQKEIAMIFDQIENNREKAKIITFPSQN